MKKEIATFGAGCFWGVEQAFSELKGIVKTRVGYMGGDEKEFPAPTYKEVCTHSTGYAEVVQIWFNPFVISYEKLLETFWKIHNPTTLNRQGLDFGSQYRSVIFYRGEKQKKVAEKSLKKHQKSLRKKIVTQIVPAVTFFEAEEYHQKYFEKNPGACHI